MKKIFLICFIGIFLMTSVSALCWNPLELFCIFDNEPEEKGEPLIECLVKSTDNIGTDDPIEEQAGNYKQGYIVLCKDREYEKDVRKEIWGSLELDPKRFAIVSMLKSEFNKSWLEPEYDKDGNITTRRAYVMPLDTFMNITEINDLKNIDYGEEVNWTIAKYVENVSLKVESVDYENRLEDIKLHGSSGNFTVCPSGCDYTTLAGFEAGEQADLNGTGPAIAKVTEGFTDTAALVISGWTTTAVDYIKVTSNGTGRHNGVFNDSNYLLLGASSDTIRIMEEYVTVDGLQVQSTDDQALEVAPFVGGAYNINISNNIFKCNSTSTFSGCTRFSGLAANTKIYIFNNLFFDGISASLASIQMADADATFYIYSNTIVNMSRGISHTSGTEYIKNNIIVAADAFIGTFANNDSRNDYNSISQNEDNVAIGSNGRFNQAFSFEDETNNNYNLNANDTGALEFGVDLSSDPNLAFDTDIIGTIRPQDTNWDIGALERIVSGDAPPTFSDIIVNSTTAGQSTNFSILWDDDVALEDNGQYIFSTNNTGVWVNDSAINFTTTPSAANVIKTLNSTEGLSIGYRWYATDNAGNENDTGIQTLTTTGADTCTYTSGNWEVDCADNCVINSPVDVEGNNISIIGTGTFFTSSDISNYNLLHTEGTDASNICRVTCDGGCFI